MQSQRPSRRPPTTPGRSGTAYPTSQTFYCLQRFPAYHTVITSLRMANHTKHFLAVTMGLISVASLVHGQRIRNGKRSDISCGANYYVARTNSGYLACVRCPMSCDPGTTIETQCGFGVPQTCRPCVPTPGRTCASGVERSCFLCDVYGRTVDAECNIYNQTTCGDCKEGYYENLDDAKIGNTRYCRKCTPADSWRQQCQLQPTSEQMTPSSTPDKLSTTDQMAIMYSTVITQRNEKLSTSKTLIQRLRKSTETTRKAKDGPIEWGALAAGLVMTLLMCLLFAFIAYRYRSYGGQKGKETTDIELTTISRDVTDENVTEYDRLYALGKEVGKDLPIEDHLTIDMQQTIAARINQRPATPGDPDYRNFFIDLGVDMDTVAAANATGIDDPSARLFRVLLQESPEIKMADIIATLDKHKFYGPVKDICQKITDDNATEPK